MKKIFVITTLLLVLSLTSFAESTNSETDAASDFFSSAASWLNNVSEDAVAIGQSISTFFADGTETAATNMTEYVQMAEQYLREIYPQWDDEISKAWSVLADAANQGSAAVSTETAAAYETILNWMQETGELMSTGTQEILDSIGSAAGVAEAEISIWIRTIQTYFDEKKQDIPSPVMEAWDIVKQSARDIGAISAETFKSSCQVISDWLNQSESAETESVQNALSHLEKQTEISK